QAFREAFGHTLAEALAELPAYLKTIRPVALPAFSEAPRPVTAAKISADDAAIARAGLALNLKHPELAASLLEKLGETAQAEAMRGSVALARDCRDEARRHLDRAIQLGNRDAALYFEYAMLERESGRPDAELLGKVIAIDPGFGDALFLLGVRETDDGNLRDAIEHLRAAVRAQPEKSTWWHALGYAQAKAGDVAAARQSARRALATAENDSEMKMAEALAAVEREDSPRRRAGVVTPPSWQPRHRDARVEGILQRFDCEASPPRIEVRSGSGESLTLLLLRPSEIELVNAASASLELPCGALHLPVAIEYELGSASVTRIEFRL
ncbi:MAG: hypothetical protein LAO79_25265, partial [Acidobacteriia bacterium]|nr:hypothetical protein [Terriglobia bacterium]